MGRRRATLREAGQRLAVEPLEHRRMMAVVTSAGDTGPGTLRDALAGFDTLITFDVVAMGTSTINLASQLIVDRTVVIDGNDGSGGRVEVNGSLADRVFLVDDGNTATTAFVAINTLKISDGLTSTSGGGISNFENLNLIDVDISNNSAAEGGGLANYAVVDIAQSLLSGNSASEGGAILNRGELDSSDSIFRTNSATGSGGALKNYGDVYSHTDTFVNNTAGSDGGAIATDGILATRYVAISQNFAAGYGGGIDASGRTELVDTTLDNNEAQLGGGGSADKGTTSYFQVTISGNKANAGFGGGILSFAMEAVTSIDLSTITNNQGKGGGIAILAGSSMTLQRSIVSGNVNNANMADDIYNPANPITPNYTFIGIDTGAVLVGGVGNIIGSGVPIDAMLNPLAYNGGPNLAMQTHRPLPLSPVVDQIPVAWMELPLFDQRGIGFPRVQNASVDMGSVEIPDCDFDDNGDYSHDDANALSRQIARGTFDGRFDVNGDGQLDIQDLDAWLFFAGIVEIGAPYLKADFNLDGFVDGLDFIIWNRNRFSKNANFCDGDANADGTIDATDFIVWNELKFTSSTGPMDVPHLPHPTPTRLRNLKRVEVDVLMADWLGA